MAILSKLVIAFVVLATIALFSSIASNENLGGGMEMKAMRDLPDKVCAGSNFSASINFTAPADEFNSIGAKEVANETAGMRIYLEKEDVTPTPDYMKLKNNTAEIIWYGPYDSGTEFCINYSVYMPEDVGAGNYTFNGGVEYYIKGEYHEVYILGDNIIDP